MTEFDSTDPERLVYTRVGRLPEAIRNKKLVEVRDENGEPVPGQFGQGQYKLVPRDDGYGPESGDRETPKPLPGLGGAAVELTQPKIE